MACRGFSLSCSRECERRAVRLRKRRERREKQEADGPPPPPPLEPLEPWNFRWVAEGRLAIMGCLKSPENVKYVLDQGIMHLVSLSPEKQPPFEYFPIYLRWTPLDVLEFEPPTLEQMITFIKICEESRKLREAVGVHCRMGRGRSGVMAACYLVRFKGMHPDKAIMRIRLLTKGAIETYFQERAVWAYWDHLKRTRSPSPDLETESSNVDVKGEIVLKNDNISD